MTNIINITDTLEKETGRRKDYVFISLFGSHVYGLNDETSDMDWRAFVSPSFEELYNKEMYSKKVITEAYDLDVHDVRKIPQLFYKSNLNFLEVLFSTSITMNNAFPEIKEIMSLRDDIVKMNLPYLYKSCYGMHMQKMSLLNKGSEFTQNLIEAHGYCTKNALHAYRVLNFIIRFAESDFKDFGKCIWYTGEDKKFMMEIKKGIFNEDTYRKFIDHYYHSEFVHAESKYMSQKPNEELRDRLNLLIMNMIKRHLMGVA